MTRKLHTTLAAAALLAGPVAVTPAAAAASAGPAMVAIVHQASGTPSSYFQVSSRPGRATRAGELELRNTRNHPVVVMLDPVGSLTASTLGSAYRLRGTGVAGPASWIAAGRRTVTLPARGTVNVPVWVRVPRGVAGGDYLSGLSVQARTAPRKEKRGTVTIASVQRYAVGVLVRLPGARHPRIDLTAASVRREPSGITFFVTGRNSGNAILQNVRGSILVTSGRRVVARVPVGPGTFVTGTSIAYPVMARAEQPREGAVYRVRATMRYRGGVARLDTRVRFGHADAEVQHSFGGPPARDPGRSRTPILLVALIAIFLLSAAAGAVALRRRLGRRAPVGMAAALAILEPLLAEARATGDPLTVVRLAHIDDGPVPAGLADAVSDGLRGSDRLCRLSAVELLVAAPDTPFGAAATLTTELRRRLARVAEAGTIEITVTQPERGDDAARLVERVRQPFEFDEITLSPDSFAGDRLTR